MTLNMVFLLIQITNYLEINQAGLSWNTILNKQENFRKAYSNFTIKTIANYDDKERTRLLNDAGIIY